MIRSWGQNNKMLHRVIIFKLVRFKRKWAQIDQTTEKVYFYVCWNSGKMWIKRSKFIAHIWPITLTFNPYLIIGTSKLYETIHFLINLSPFSLKLDQLENLTSVWKVNDLLLFSSNWIFCSFWPKEEFDITTLLNHVDYFTTLADLWTLTPL